MWATVTPENINIWFVAAEVDVGFMIKGEFGSLGLFRSWLIGVFGLSGFGGVTGACLS